ncbi:MAG TPA: hypothetical protein VM186_07120 [Planctomycetota bacterium]|nr:hypothetical protein [Planctomycetota bacterium]
MGKLKGNVFWVFMAVILLAELCIYLLPVPGTVSRMKGDSASRLEELGRLKDQLDGLRQPGNAANDPMIQAAEKRKAELHREYLRMCLLLIGKDDMIDRFFDIGTRIIPARRLNLTPRERTLLLNQILNARDACKQMALDARIGMDTQSLPWDWLKVEGETPTAKMLIYAHKQVYIQQKLLEAMKGPAPAAEAKGAAEDAKDAGAKADDAAKEPEAAPAATAEPETPAANPAPDAAAKEGNVVRLAEKEPALVPLFNKVIFKIPEKREDMPFDPRYVYYTVSLDVSMLPRNVPFLIERIINCGLPLSITSFTIERGMSDRISAAAAARVQTTGQAFVTVKVECKVLDFSGAISKVEFARGQFPDQAAVENYLNQQNDPVMKALATEISKGSFKEPENADAPIRCEVYGDMLNSEPMECELEKGITVYFGTVEHNVPELRVR